MARVGLLDKFAVAHLSGDDVYRYEPSKVLHSVMRDYQPIWRMRSWMSAL